MPEMRPVAGYEGFYSVTKDGRVWSHHKSMWLKLCVCSYGYHRVTLKKNRSKREFRVHRLVATAWIPKPATSAELDVNHISGIKTDNRVENLEWATRKENCRHAISTGLWTPDRVEVKRMGIAQRKLTVEQAQSIVAAYRAGRLQKDLAVEYGISKSTVNYICNGRRYVATI